MLRVLTLLIAAGLAVPAFAQSKTYYWVATAYNTAGLQSAPSNEASKEVSVADPTAKLSWGLPMMNTDGSPLTDLAGIRLYRSETSDGCATLAPETCTRITDTQSATVTEYTDTPPLPTVPAAPLNLTVQAASPTAYMLQLSHDAMALVPVGTAPAGVACGAQHVTDRNGITAYMIPSDAVEWAGSVRSGATFAQCSAG